ncbi:MAG: DUF3592 domain-containing protein [Lactobacillales bacterium]|jgi:hypothetical protein|nr:DUF3592 domain-containing protein [Lactobacillales bacterium]
MQTNFGRNTGNQVKTPVGGMLFGVLFMALPLFMGVIFLASNLRYNGSDYVEAQGHVVSYDISQNSSDRYVKYPIVEYDVKGKQYEVRDNMGSSSVPGIGREMTVKYNKKYPDEAVVKDKAGFGMIGGLGVFVLVGLAVFVTSLRSFLRGDELLPSYRRNRYDDDVDYDYCD